MPSLKDQKLLARVRIVPNDRIRKGRASSGITNAFAGWTWRIELGHKSANRGFRIEAIVHSEWRYQTANTAEVAANRWLGRLGLQGRRYNRF